MSRITTYGYDLNGNLVLKGVGNGMSEKRTHDARNRVSTLENVVVGGGSDVSEYAYGYDAAGNVMEVAETYPSGELAARTITNSYDGVYRLLNEEIATTGGDTVTTGYTYDKGHNRLTKVVTGGSDAGTTTSLIGDGSNGAGANQIISATLPDSSEVDFTYDANGNRITRSAGGNTDEYSYDYENRLVGLDYETGESGTGMYGYGYDYRTRRVARTEPEAGTIQIVFVGGVSIMEFESGGAGSPDVEYVRGHDYGGGVGGLEYSVRNGHVSFNQFDSRGDVVGKADASGAITYQAAYEAFGEHPVENGSTEDRQKANTKEEDPTGLLNEGFRYRDLETGTFITRDPLGFNAGPNVYAYVYQNPWTHFDPEGLRDETNQEKKELEKLDQSAKSLRAQAADDRVKASKEKDPNKQQQFNNQANDAEKKAGKIEISAKTMRQIVGYMTNDAPDISDVISGKKMPWVRKAAEELGNTSGDVYWHAMGQTGITNSWCACFSSWALEAVGYQSMHSAGARDYDRYGDRSNDPSFGAIGTIHWPKGPEDKQAWKGHSTIVIGTFTDEKGQQWVVGLGGNQDKMVKMKAYPVSYKGYQKPMTFSQPSGVPATAAPKMNWTGDRLSTGTER